MNSKAQIGIPLTTIIELIVVLAVIILPLLVVNALTEEGYVQREIIAGDLELMINALVAIPGDASVKYPLDDSINISNYIIVVNNDQIKLHDFDENEEKYKINKKYLLPEGYTVQGNVEQQESFCLRKEGKGVFLENCPVQT